MPAFATTRIALGFLLAPLAGILVLSLFVCLSGPNALGHAASCIGDTFPFLTWVGLFCAYPPTLLLGVPLFFVLKRYNQVRPVPLALAGLVVGAAAAALFFLIEEKFSIKLMVQWVPFAMRAGVGWAGPIAGLAFWGVAVFRNTVLTRA
jgi:hypothetical protein